MTVSNHPTNARRGPTGGDRARLWLAVVLSAAGHLAMLAGWRAAASNTVPKVITARLVASPETVEQAPRDELKARAQPAATASARPPVSAAPAMPVRAAGKTAVNAAPVPPPTRVAVDAPSAFAVPSSPATATADAAAVPVAPGSERTPAIAMAAPVPAVPMPPPAPAGDGAAGSSATYAELDAYWRSLARVALTYKRYPPLARERGWEGTVELAVTVLPRHPEPVIRVARGSGFSLLDDQAREMMARAIRRLPVPEALRETRAEHIFPVRYSITD